MPADPTAAQLKRLQARTARSLDRLMAQVAGGSVNRQQAIGRARTLLRVSHAIAADLGVQRGGGSPEVRRQAAIRRGWQG